jgi:MOSC domain
MYGVPSGVVWDPDRAAATPSGEIEDGFLIAATDISLAMPTRPGLDAAGGVVERICVAPSAGEAVACLEKVSAIAGKGLDGDRHLVGRGTFPSGISGSALTLIQAEVCESFDPPLAPEEHRRNLVVRGVELNTLVGHEFRIGDVLCRGMRLCEPCTVIDRYASRSLLRPLVHRGGLRADILTDGEISVGDELAAAER